MSEARAVTPLGRLRGRRLETDDRVDAARRGPVDVFFAVPYAAPPVGPLRFEVPEPARPWVGERDASMPGAAPPQSAVAAPVPGVEVASTSEDCLTVDVWAPVGAQRLPVMVWVPGGAFMSGWSAATSQDARRLAADGRVVVVSVNYRVGALGFCAFDGPDAPTNLGLRDQLAAFAWVRDNVGSFGGDPNNVTAFGISAGAGSILHLMAGDRAAAAFDRAIAQSGATDRTLDPEAAQKVATQMLAELGATDYRALREVAVDEIISAQERTMMALLGDVGMMPFHPVVDGDVVPARPALMTDARPLVIGRMRDEMRLYLDIAGIAELTRDRVLRRTARYLAANKTADHDAAGPLYAAYEAAYPQCSAGERWALLFTDGEMSLPAWKVADAHTRNGPTWQYRFDRPARRVGLGACHGLDIPYTFGTFDRGWEEFAGVDEGAWNLSAKLRSAWTGFASVDAPIVPGTPEWPRNEATRRPTMIFDDVCRVSDDPDGLVRRAWFDLTGWGPGG